MMIDSEDQLSTRTRSVEVDGVEMFYREAGSPDAPVILLLHGFPSSSHQYRNLIPRLADRYRVIAPDFPGFGFTKVPRERVYKYSFDNLAVTLRAFTQTLKLEQYALYVFDYGAPIGFRLAMTEPRRVAAIISQNGNAYEEGLGPAWFPIQNYWWEPKPENRDKLRGALTLEQIKDQYVAGIPHPERVVPESYTLDAALITQNDTVEIQLDLFLDYQNNIQLYPAFQDYFRKEQPLLLALWGRFDSFFLPAGAAAFRKDIPDAKVQMFDAGHFALETDVDFVAEAVRTFLGEIGY